MHRPSCHDTRPLTILRPEAAVSHQGSRRLLVWVRSQTGPPGPRMRGRSGRQCGDDLGGLLGKAGRCAGAGPSCLLLCGARWRALGCCHQPDAGYWRSPSRLNSVTFLLPGANQVEMLRFSGPLGIFITLTSRLFAFCSAHICPREEGNLFPSKGKEGVTY